MWWSKLNPLCNNRRRQSHAFCMVMAWGWEMDDMQINFVCVCVIQFLFWAHILIKWQKSSLSSEIQSPICLSQRWSKLLGGLHRTKALLKWWLLPMLAHGPPATNLHRLSSFRTTALVLSLLLLGPSQGDFSVAHYTLRTSRSLSKVLSA